MSFKCPRGRLTAEGVKHARELRRSINPKTGKVWTYQAIAGELGISIGTAYEVCKRRTWKDL